MKTLSKQLATAGQYYIYQDGELITLREIMQREKGRRITTEEVIEYVTTYSHCQMDFNKGRENFINEIKRKAKQYEKTER